MTANPFRKHMQLQVGLAVMIAKVRGQFCGGHDRHFILKPYAISSQFGGHDRQSLRSVCGGHDRQCILKP